MPAAGTGGGPAATASRPRGGTNGTAQQGAAPRRCTRTFVRMEVEETTGTHGEEGAAGAPAGRVEGIGSDTAAGQSPRPRAADGHRRVPRRRRASHSDAPHGRRGPTGLAARAGLDASRTQRPAAPGRARRPPPPRGNGPRPRRGRRRRQPRPATSRQGDPGPGRSDGSTRQRLLRRKTYGYGKEEPLGSGINGAAQPPSKGGRGTTQVPGVSPAGRPGARGDRGACDAGPLERRVPVPVVWTRTAGSQALTIAARGSGEQARRRRAGGAPAQATSRRTTGADRRPKRSAGATQADQPGREASREAPRGGRGAPNVRRTGSSGRPRVGLQEVFLDVALGGQFKTGHLWTPQIRPFPASRDGS